MRSWLYIIKFGTCAQVFYSTILCAVNNFYFFLSITYIFYKANTRKIEIGYDTKTT